VNGQKMNFLRISKMFLFTGNKHPFLYFILLFCFFVVLNSGRIDFILLFCSFLVLNSGRIEWTEHDVLEISKILFTLPRRGNENMLRHSIPAKQKHPPTPKCWAAAGETKAWADDSIMRLICQRSRPW